jgi:hypothetical protein
MRKVKVVCRYKGSNIIGTDFHIYDVDTAEEITDVQGFVFSSGIDDEITTIRLLRCDISPMDAGTITADVVKLGDKQEDIQDLIEEVELVEMSVFRTPMSGHDKAELLSDL